jgi:hypothetical protein
MRVQFQDAFFVCYVPDLACAGFGLLQPSQYDFHSAITCAGFGLDMQGGAQYPPALRRPVFTTRDR